MHCAVVLSSLHPHASLLALVFFTAPQLLSMITEFYLLDGLVVHQSAFFSVEMTVSLPSSCEFKKMDQSQSIFNDEAARVHKSIHAVSYKTS